MEKHIVNSAIIMAAGIGKRLQPLTLKTPKPLIEVNGIRMIDTVIHGLHKNGIFEIYVVVGHLKEMFRSLPEQYPGLQLIENPYYDSCNNISSLYVAREHLGDCMILDGDQMIYNPDVLDTHFSRSGYNAVWKEDYSDEWMLTVDQGIIRGCSRTGGCKGWQLYSISRWTMEDGEKLRYHLEQEFKSGNRQIYWDDVPLFCHFNQYQLGIHEMKPEDVTEIDTLQELAIIDPVYQPCS